ncbi:MAG: methyltransferase domain-containing protein [Methanomethylophilus sp.]|nr:methyltransferase domain-containing protein [Methanomethylophilus sp.]
MELQEIAERWRAPQTRNAGAVWDARAEHFDFAVSGPDDPYIALLLREGRLDPARTDVLDIGCGTGVHSLALAGHVCSVRGVDVSSAMVARANRKAAALGLTNAQYEVLDWAAADPAALGKFGLVMAHMTPAINSAVTFAKMTSVAAGMCFLTGYVNRNNPIWDRIYEIIGTDGNTESDKLLFAQDLLWRQNRDPHLFYERRHRDQRLTPADAVVTYVEGARSISPLTSAQEQAIRDCLRFREVDGTVYDVSDPLIATLWWDASQA